MGQSQPTHQSESEHREHSSVTRNHRLEMMFGISYFLQFLTVVSVIFELVTPIPTPNCVNVGNNGQRRPICNGDFCENPQNYPEELITQLIQDNPPPRGLFDS